MGTSVRRRVVAGALTWFAAIGVVVAVAHPESCPTPSAQAVRQSVDEAVRWIAVNQADDGTFLYRYDRGDEQVVAGYSTVRHAGTLLALEQARGAGVAEADEVAARGLRWAKGQLTELDGDRTALTGATGATALIALALLERRGVDDSTADDDLLRSLGRFLLDAVTTQGAVVAQWDLGRDEPVAGSRSPFFTGEVLWALARLHAALPAEGWDEPARRVSRYLVTERDDAERRFPPVSEHWGSYALAEMAAWPDAPPDGQLTDDELAYARRQAGLFGVQARYESQRRESGIVRITRGPYALTAGIATVGEGLGGIWRIDRIDDELDVDGEAVGDRLVCVAGMLVERQEHSDDPRTDGAWFRLGVTQVDDEQHAISALLAALPVIEERS